MEKIYGYISKKFKKKVLENAKESDQIIIITGYFSPDMIDEIAKMGVPFVYYYGMYGIDKIAKPVYDKYGRCYQTGKILLRKKYTKVKINKESILWQKIQLVKSAMRFPLEVEE